jgi:AcrR family transcriptional regulator
MPKIVDSDRYRKELLYQCFDVLAEKGYANVTTRQLSQLLGISTGALYHYFPSKKDLFEQLVVEISQQDVRMLQTVAEGVTTLPERIRALGQLLIEHESYFVKQAALWVDFYRHTDIKEIQNNPVFQQIDAGYQQAMMSVLGISEPKVAQFVVTLVDGLLVEQLEGDVGLSFPEQIDLLTKMLIAYFEKYER